MGRIKQSVAIAIVGCAVALAACGSGGDDEGGAGATNAAAGSHFGKMSLGMQDPFSVLPAFLAQDEGFFKRHGISDFEIVPFTSLPAMLTSVSRGQISAAQQTPAALRSFNADSRVQLRFFQPAQRPSLTWTARKDSGIPPATATDWKTTVKAFKGKTIGVPAIGGLVDIITRYMAQQVGLRVDKDYTISVVATGQAAIAALKAKTIDIGVSDTFTAAVLTTSGVGQVVLSEAPDQGPSQFLGTLQSGVMAPQSALTKDKKKYAAFAAALTEARSFMFDPANRATVERVLADHLKVSAPVASALYDVLPGTFAKDLDEAAVVKTGTALTGAGLMKPPAPGFSDLAQPVSAS